MADHIDDVPWKLVAEACRGAAPLAVIAERLLAQGWLPPDEVGRQNGENVQAREALADLLAAAQTMGTAFPLYSRLEAASERARTVLAAADPKPDPSVSEGGA